MAGQDCGDAVNTLSFVGIDPGDVWCGYATLRISGRRWQAATGVYDRRQLTLPEVTHRLIHSDTDVVVVERYQQRPVGHQAWNSGETLQLIGALRYVTEFRRMQWATVPTGDPDKELPALLIDGYLQAWRPTWAQSRSPHWHHARAAWRVLARYMLTNYGALWSTLADPAMLSSLRVGTAMPTDRMDDLCAPLAEWAVPTVPTRKQRLRKY